MLVQHSTITNDQVYALCTTSNPGSGMREEKYLTGRTVVVNYTDSTYKVRTVIKQKEYLFMFTLTVRIVHPQFLLLSFIFCHCYYFCRCLSFVVCCRQLLFVFFYIYCLLLFVLYCFSFVVACGLSFIGVYHLSLVVVCCLLLFVVSCLLLFVVVFFAVVVCRFSFVVVYLL